MLHCRFSLVFCAFLIGLYFVDFLTTCGSTRAQMPNAMIVVMYKPRNLWLISNSNGVKNCWLQDFGTTQLTQLRCGNVVWTFGKCPDNVWVLSCSNVFLWTPENVVSTLGITLRCTFLQRRRDVPGRTCKQRQMSNIGNLCSYNVMLGQLITLHQRLDDVVRQR
jgi:hypothetical protein